MGKSKHIFKGLKVLKHKTYQVRKWGDERLLHELDVYHTEIEPVFHRDGEYLLGGKCWFEVRGRAFLTTKQAFLLELRQQEMLDHDVAVVNKLKEIQRISPSILTKDQEQLIVDYDFFLYWRGQKRDSRKRVKDMKERLRIRRLEVEDWKKGLVKEVKEDG